MAVSILMVGLVAVMQWFALGTSGVDTGRRQSTAVFLAEQKIEQIKNSAASQGFATLVQGGACCANEAFNTIPGYGDYSRTVTIANGPTATTKLVRVQVSYRRVTDRGTQTGIGVDIPTLIAQR